MNAKKTVKVLAIGNSFSISLMRELPAVAENLGVRLDLCCLYIGGCSLERHAANLKKPDENPYSVSWSYVSAPHDEAPVVAALVRADDGKGWRGNIPKVLAADAWDVVTIQQASHQSWQAGSYEPAGTELLSAIAALAPGAKIFFQQTWSYTPWDGRLARWGIDQNEMFARLEDASGRFAAAHGIPLVRMGEAVQLYRARTPELYGERVNNDVCGTDSFEEKDGAWTHSGDAFHLNRKGEFFQALVWAAALFGSDVEKADYVPPCLAGDPAAVADMRRIAMQVAGQAPGRQ